MRQSKARERILDTACDLFHQRGYTEVGVNEIIEKSETAKATFYQHFRSKEELCCAWLDAIHDRSETGRTTILSAEGDPIKKIDEYFEFLENYLIANDFRGCPYSNTAAVVEEGCCQVRRQIEDHKLSIRDFFRQLAAEFAATGERAQSLGDALFLLYSGATGEAQNLRAIWPVKAARETAAALCLNAKNG